MSVPLLRVVVLVDSVHPELLLVSVSSEPCVSVLAVDRTWGRFCDKMVTGLSGLRGRGVLYGLLYGEGGERGWGGNVVGVLGGGDFKLSGGGRGC